MSGSAYERNYHKKEFKWGGINTADTAKGY